MYNKALEIAAQYVDQILHGEIRPTTMLEYMRELEDGYRDTTSLFEQAGLDEDKGYLALGTDRQELYMHITCEALSAIGRGFDTIETAEIAFARGMNRPQKQINYTDIVDVHDHAKSILNEIREKRETDLIGLGDQDIPTADL